MINLILKISTTKIPWRKLLTQQRLMSIHPDTRALADGILNSNRASLAKAITLIESSKREHIDQATYLLEYLVQSSPKQPSSTSFRLGVAGPPGAGKSTFIEKLGMRLVEKTERVAVISVDPSSHVSGGSILGDKTRMERLSKVPQAYVRATPTRGVLGGIAEHTVDVITLCEAAGFNNVIVESVGLGQSEISIDSAVDMLLLVVPPGGGDSLQASKKGIMEACDLVIVNKADRDLLNQAKHTTSDYKGTMQFIRRKHIDWAPPVLMVSAATGFQLDKVESAITEFRELMERNGALSTKRVTQGEKWLVENFRRGVIQELEGRKEVQRKSKELESMLKAGSTTPRAAAVSLKDYALGKSKS